MYGDVNIVVDNYIGGSLEADNPEERLNNMRINEKIKEIQLLNNN